MRKLILFLGCLLATTSSLWADGDYDFSAACSSGQTLYYKINADGNSVTVVPQNAESPYYSSYPTGSLTIPAEVEYDEKTYAVTALGEHAFYGCEGLTSVSMPNSITSVNKYIFSQCTNLASVTLSNAITLLHDNMFYKCSSLTSLEIPNSVVKIGFQTFAYCSNLNVTIPSSITFINASAFYECTSLTSFTIPTAVTYVGQGAFVNTGWWKNQSDGVICKDNWCLGYKGEKPSGAIEIQDGIIGVAHYAFRSCDAITSVSLPNTVKYIIGYAFLQCSALASVNLPESIIEINSSAFNGTALTSFTIPASVKVMSASAFKNTPWWNNQDDGIICKDGWCMGYKGDKPTGEITIPEGTMYVGADAFSKCDEITSVVLPSTQLSIGKYVFNACTGITAVSCEALTPPTIDSLTFVGCTYEDITLTVHAGSVEAYQDAPWWEKFNVQSFSYTVTVTSADENMGTVSGSNTYVGNTTATLTATPVEHYHFLQWSDGNTDNPRTLTVVRDSNLTATFAIDTFMLTINVNNEAWGSVAIDEEAEAYAYGTEVTLTATPAENYQFVSWSDEETEAVRTITITDDVELTATFEPISEDPDAIAEANSSNAQIFGSNQRIVINNAEAANVAIYDMMGRSIVKEQRINTNNEIFAVPQTGMYIVRMGKAAKKVFVR